MLGGGTGTFTVLSSLKYYASDITAVVNMVDDGGSTGVLRDEFGVLPPGDVRQSLVALSSSPQVLRDLFNYRFGEGSLAGHAFGNLFLTALEKMTGSFPKAVEVAGDLLRITGRVVPVTTDNVRLCLETLDGKRIVGEQNITKASFAGTEPPRLTLEPQATINSVATKAITEADVIILGPGNVYSSLVPILLVEGVPEALAAAKGKFVYVCNLVTKPGQTDGFTVADFVRVFERYLGRRKFDYVIYNTGRPDPRVLEKYARAGEYWVESDEGSLREAPYEAIGESLIARTQHMQDPNDKLLERTLIRHDGDRLARIIMRIYFS